MPTQAGRLGRLDAELVREQLAGLARPHAAEQQIPVALAIIEHLNVCCCTRWISSSSATRAVCTAAAR